VLRRSLPVRRHLGALRRAEICVHVPAELEHELSVANRGGCPAVVLERLLPSDLGELTPASNGALDFVNGHHHDPSAGKPNAAGCSQRAIATTAVLLRGPGVTSS